jgi:predicted transcriptional regulator of viral defense system
MVVKYGPAPLERVRQLLHAQHGLLRTADLAKHGLARAYPSVLEEQDEITPLSRGVYAAAGALPDEMAHLQERFGRAIFSHETALALHDLTGRTPLAQSVTVPSGYNAAFLKASGARVFFVRRDLHAVGEVRIPSPHGNAVNTYDLERTLVDVLRSRNQIDVQLVNEAVKRYVRKEARDLHRLYQVAAQFRVLKLVRQWVEVLL